MCQCFFSIMKERDSETDRVREWDSVTDGGRVGRANLAVTAFSLLMNDIFLPPQHSLGLQSVNLSRVIWPDYCVNLEYSSGSLFSLRAETLLWTCRVLTHILTFYIHNSGEYRYCLMSCVYSCLDLDWCILPSVGFRLKCWLGRFSRTPHPFVLY